MKQVSKLSVLCLCLAVLGSGIAFAAPTLDLANAGGEVSWHIAAPYETAHLRVTGPHDYVFEADFVGQAPSFLASGLADGNYQWSLLAVSGLADTDRGRLEKARIDGDVGRVLAELKASGAFSSHDLYGSFRIAGGQLIVPGTDGVLEPGANPKPAGRAGEKDIQHLDDVIIAFSLCVGNDCVNGESFGFDTVRLKENNLRLHFQDTSNSASFPSNDWRIVINDSSNGGDNYFAVEDSTAGRQPFRVDAGAPANSLRVDSAGDVGIGTSNPVVDIHAVSGNTPTLRLEQNGSSGFTPQTFDVAANEANFFIRDVTNGSELPFKIKPGADTGALFIAADNDIGMGTESPAGPLHVRRTAAATDTTMLTLEANGGSRVSMIDNSANGETWFFQNDSNSDGFIISQVGSNGSEVRINTRCDDGTSSASSPFACTSYGSTSTLIVDGSVDAQAFNMTSSREKKQAFQAVDTAEILQKLAGIEIQTWRYKGQADSITHMGPMAEDFSATFGLGTSDKTLSTVDVNGVALAAIQALNDRLNNLEQENAELKQLIRKMAGELE